MSAIAMRMRTHKGLTAIQQGIALLRRLGDRASVFVPGVASVSGAHWINGASLTPTSGIQSIGPELAINGDFSNGTTGWTLWQPTVGIVQAESGGCRIRSTDGSFAQIQQSGLLLSIGSTYRITFTVKGWVSGRLAVTTDGTNTSYLSAFGPGTYTFDTTVTSVGVLQFKRPGGETCDLIVDDVSCKLVTTMPTSAWLMDYVESSAATAASVDGPIGFLSDGMGVTGPNVIANNDFSSGSTNWSLGAGWTVSGGLATHASAGGASAIGQGSALVIGETYIATVTSPNPVAFNAVFGGAYVSIGWKGNVGTCIGVCTASTTFGVQGGGDISFSKIVVQKLTGRNATQGTGANKPALRRGVTNLLSYSSQFGNVAWAVGGAPTLTPGQQDPSGGTAGTLFARTTTGSTLLSQGLTKAASALPFTAFFAVKPNSGRYFSLRSQGTYPARADAVFDLQTGAVYSSSATSGFSGASASVAAMPNGFWLVCLSAVTDTATAIGVFLSPSSNGVQVDGGDSALSTCYIHAGGLAQGALTAQQILQCGGIPLTNGAAASSVVGNFKLSYAANGTQSLALPSAPFAVTDDHVVIQGLTAQDTASTHASFAMANGSSRFPVLYVGAGGYPSVSWRDDTGVGVTATAPQVNNGDSFVLTARKVGTAGTARKNGVAYPVTITGIGTTTATAAFIGASTGGSINWAGDIYPTVTVRGALTDAELLVLERFVGALTGPIGVKF